MSLRRLTAVLLIKDCANTDRSDTRFPFMRYFDVYAGHSWANGPALFAEGNNQESSSEDMNFATSLVLWDGVIGDDTIRDLGIYLHSTIAQAIEQYWFDVDDSNFPAAFERPVLGMVWGSGGKYDTWWDRNPTYAPGIDMLPFTGGSRYMGARPDFVLRNYDSLVSANKGPVVLWQDIIWMYLALADADKAAAFYDDDPYFEVEFGNTGAFLYHWITSLRALGRG